jgi:hypothetical protein
MFDTFLEGIHLGWYYLSVLEFDDLTRYFGDILMVKHDYQSCCATLNVVQVYHLSKNAFKNEICLHVSVFTSFIWTVNDYTFKKGFFSSHICIVSYLLNGAAPLHHMCKAKEAFE